MFILDSHFHSRMRFIDLFYQIHLSSAHQRLGLNVSVVFVFESNLVSSKWFLFKELNSSVVQAAESLLQLSHLLSTVSSIELVVYWMQLKLACAWAARSSISLFWLAKFLTAFDACFYFTIYECEILTVDILNFANHSETCPSVYG